MLGAPELGAELQVGSHECRVEGLNHLLTAGHTSLDISFSRRFRNLDLCLNSIAESLLCLC